MSLIVGKSFTKKLLKDTFRIFHLAGMCAQISRKKFGGDTFHTYSAVLHAVSFRCRDTVPSLNSLHPRSHFVHIKVFGDKFRCVTPRKWRKRVISRSTHNERAAISGIKNNSHSRRDPYNAVCRSGSFRNEQ